MPPRARECCTCAVRVPASGVPYVPRTVASQASFRGDNQPTVVGRLEAWTSQIDNLFLPIYYCAVLLLVDLLVR